MDHIAGTAVLDGVVVEVKYSSPETAIVAGSKQGVYRFYLNGNDREGHKRILNYMLDNGLVRRTKSSKLYNISIKYDSKTYAGKYKGSGFSGKIKLTNYVDLETGSLYEGGGVSSDLTTVRFVALNLLIIGGFLVLASAIEAFLVKDKEKAWLPLVIGIICIAAAVSLLFVNSQMI